jgi:RimJ/RimL family protein N-acetyltransferase
MQGAPRLETDRLVLRAWAERDLDPYAALCADPHVMRYIGNGRPQTRDQAAAAMASFREGWSERGYDLWCLTRIGDDVCIGFVGLHAPDFLPEIMPAVEIGWRLAHDAWGQGYATEAAVAARDFAFRSAGVDRLVSIAHADNDASANVMRKLGMQLERATVHPVHGVPIVVYELDRMAAG